MVRRTVPILVRITRSSVDGRPVRTTCSTDQQLIRTGVDGSLEYIRYVNFGFFFSFFFIRFSFFFFIRI